MDSTNKAKVNDFNEVYLIFTVDPLFKEALLRDAPVITRNTCVSIMMQKENSMEISKLEYLVLDCSPLVQGVISHETAVILVKPEPVSDFLK
jgi:hypothetical protein